MASLARFTAVALSASVLLVTVPGIANAERRVVPRHPPHPERAVVVRGHVVVGGYFDDPLSGRGGFPS